MLERCYVAIGGEVIGGDHDEHRFCGESGGPFGVGAGRADVQHAAFPGGDVRGDAVGSMQLSFLVPTIAFALVSYYFATEVKQAMATGR